MRPAVVRTGHIVCVPLAFATVESAPEEFEGCRKSVERFLAGGILSVCAKSLAIAGSSSRASLGRV